MTKTIELPERGIGTTIIASISGGKDSAALAIALQEAGIPFVAVFADTGWEAPETYDHLSVMEAALGISIHRVGAPGGMLAKIRQRAGFPARKQRWCTRELKIEPLDAFARKIADSTQTSVTQALGIRADESESRAKMAGFEFVEDRDLYVWRPLLEWSIEDVLAAHHRAALPVNPLYKRGHERVGCWPCIYAPKEEIRLWAEHDPARYADLVALEIEVEEERARRNEEQPGRYAHKLASYFQARESIRDKQGNRTYLPVHVDKVVDWSKTDRGGKQGLLVRDEPDGGCFRWGMCEPPAKSKSTDEGSSE